MRRLEMIKFQECKRGRRRLKKSWDKVIKHNLKSLQLTKDMAQDMGLSTSRAKVVDCMQLASWLWFGC